MPNAWKALHCSLSACGFLVCMVVMPLAYLVTGITVAVKWAERKEATARLTLKDHPHG
jgi:hypothetical protein